MYKNRRFLFIFVNKKMVYLFKILFELFKQILFVDQRYGLEPHKKCNLSVEKFYCFEK